MNLVDLVSQGFDAYVNFQQAHPLIGSMLTAEGTFVVGDVASQLIIDKKVDWNKVRYTAALAPLYGAGVEGTVRTGDLAGYLVHDDSLTKAVLGPNLWGNALNSLFFVNNTIGERTGYRVGKLVKHYADLALKKDSDRSFAQRFKEDYLENIPRKEFIGSVIGTLTFWNAFQYCNYEFVPEHMQTPTCLAAGIGWMALLSLWSLKGRRRVVGTEQIVH